MLKQTRQSRGQHAGVPFIPHPVSSPGLLYWCLVVTFFAVLVYIFFFSGILAVKTLRVEGGVEGRHPDVEQHVRALYSGTYLGILKKNNYIFVSEGEVEARLSEEFPAILSVTTQKTFPNELTITIVERTEVFAVCGAGETCVYADKYGVQFAYVGKKDIPQEFFVYETLSQQDPQLLVQVIPHEEVEYLSSLSERLDNVFGQTMIRRVWKPVHTNGEIRIETTQKWYIEVLTKYPPERIADLVLVAHTQSKNNEPEKELEYIDARYQEKVYYKYEDD